MVEVCLFVFRVGDDEQYEVLRIDVIVDDAAAAPLATAFRRPAQLRRPRPPGIRSPAFGCTVSCISNSKISASDTRPRQISQRRGIEQNAPGQRASVAKRVKRWKQRMTAEARLTPYDEITRLTYRPRVQK